MRPDYAKATDAELLATADADAFALIYDRHVARVFAWARARVGDYGADLAAEVFARAWLCRRSFRDQADGSAFPWLCGIAGNVLRESLRRRRVEDRARRRLGLPAAIDPDPEYEAIERRLSLPEAALRAIAERLRCTPQAARLRVSRTLRRLNLASGGEPR